LEDNAVILACLLILIVLLFEFSNGFNDCANMVVTPVVTGAMEPRTALLLIAVFEFIGAWVLGTAVADTLGKGIVNPENITIAEIFAAVFAAILWNLGGWYLGMPSSSSHALIGGLIGAVAMGSGTEWIHWGKVWEVLTILILTPIVGLIAGHFLTKRMFESFAQAKPSRANRAFKRLQIFTSVALALSHGSNDAQKGMGIISVSLLLLYQMAPDQMEKIYSPLENNAFYVPAWVIVICSTALALGVSSGGWRIMKTLGAKLYKIRPIHGFSAQVCSSAIIYVSSFFGFPVSTTQIVSSALLGAGSARRLGSVRWGIGRQIFLTWIITVPGAAVLGMIVLFLINTFL
jgi:inorganic phosphate transporter, PiT family